MSQCNVVNFNNPVPFIFFVTIDFEHSIESLRRQGDFSFEFM